MFDKKKKADQEPEEVNEAPAEETEQQPAPETPDDGALDVDTAAEEAPVKDPLKAAQAQAEEYLTLAQRVQADFENFRRRNKATRAEAYEDGAREFIKQLLPVVDNLERAIAQESSDETLMTGVKLVYKQLMEELVRLSPMMKNRQTDSFIVINELFTTAANYVAIIMGKNVLSHIINEGCHGIYVTHLRELCDVDKRVVGLSAQLDENGIQNFKILRKDVKYEACAENQINKYRLSYKQLKERLGI